MFTGIITDVGEVTNVSEVAEGKRFRVKTTYETSGIDLGASIAHAGVCLTVVELGGDWYDVEAWEEALRLTTLSQVNLGTQLNLERSLKIGDELGGHMVSGHVDGMAKIIDRQEEGDAVRYTLEAPVEFAHFIAAKGSVALDGTSLTVNKVEDNCFDVLLIRHSLEVTTWGKRQIGDLINFEVDTMARYAARLIDKK